VSLNVVVFCTISNLMIYFSEAFCVLFDLAHLRIKDSVYVSKLKLNEWIRFIALLLL